LQPCASANRAGRRNLLEQPQSDPLFEWTSTFKVWCVEAQVAREARRSTEAAQQDHDLFVL
jgi:hypothetical protein